MAIENGVHLFEIRCDYKPWGRVEKYEAFLEELAELLPKHSNPHIIGKIDRIETNSFSTGRDDYYPEHSFYRINIQYSGTIPKEEVQLNEYGKEDTHGLQYGHHFFRNSTVHFNEQMKLIKVQHHHGQSSYDWHSINSQFVDIFGDEHEAVMKAEAKASAP
jgi:hypothetical protein